MGTLKTGHGRKLNLVNKNPNTIYITVPKAANSSIKHRLGELYHGKDFSAREIHSNPFGASCDKDYIVENKDKYFIFTFVRNPWSRITSLYNNKVLKKGGGSDNIFRRHKEIKLGMSFDDFVKVMHDTVNVNYSGGIGNKTELHLRSQTSWLYHHGKQLPIDFIGKVENMDEGWQHVCENTGLTYSPMSKKNASVGKVDHWKDYYKNDETIELVSKIYEHDIRNFGYEFDS